MAWTTTCRCPTAVIVPIYCRGTEQTTITYRNGRPLVEGQRQVVIDDGLVALITTWHKGYNTSLKQKVIHRYLPEEVDLLLVKYLWLIQPFINVLKDLQAFTHLRLDPKVTPYLW